MWKRLGSRTSADRHGLTVDDTVHVVACLQVVSHRLLRGCADSCE